MPSITTPFGRGRYSAAQYQAQAAARAAIHSEPEAGRGNQPAAVHKWRLLRQLTEARAAFDIGERALTVLSALLSFHPETALSLPDAPADGLEDHSLVVFPSNRELSLRAQGLCERSIARHLADLVVAGLILRRDSPNGKRYARKSRDGGFEVAFGFDLTPLVLKATEIEDAAEREARRLARIRALRERITIARRDCAALIALLGQEGAPQPALEAAAGDLARLVAPRRHAPEHELGALADSLGALLGHLHEMVAGYETKAAKESGNAGQSDSHHLNSKTYTPEFDPSSREEGLATTGGAPPDGGDARQQSELTNGGDAIQRGLPLGLVVKACPALVEWAGGVPRDWPAFIRAAQVARMALGISADAWAEAVRAMGERVAAVTIAAILERVEQAQVASGEGGGAAPELIRSPGGYLRKLAGQARDRSYSPDAFIMAVMATARRAGPICPTRPAAAPDA